MDSFGALTLIALVFGALIFTFFVMVRASKGYDKAKQRRTIAGPSPACSTCRSSLKFVGLLELQVPEQAGAAEALGADGGRLPLEAYRCPTCRKLETFLPPSVG